MAENTAFCSETAQELDKDDNLKLKLLIHEFTLSSLGFPFAKLLRNFCGTKRILSLRVSFARKKQQFAQSFAKVISRKIALFRFCKTQVLRDSPTRVLRKSEILQFRVFLRIQFWKNLVLECLPIGHFFIIDQ